MGFRQSNLAAFPLRPSARGAQGCIATKQTNTAMKHFTESDVKPGAYPTIYADRSELIYAPLLWHKQGLSQTATGYGGKLNTGQKIHFNGRAYRLYCTCYSNAGSVWFKAKGRQIWVN